MISRIEGQISKAGAKRQYQAIYTRVKGRIETVFPITIRVVLSVAIHSHLNGEKSRVGYYHRKVRKKKIKFR